MVSRGVAWCVAGMTVCWGGGLHGVVSAAADMTWRRSTVIGQWAGSWRGRVGARGDAPGPQMLGEDI